MLALLTTLSPILDKVLGAFLPDQGKRQEVIMTILSQFQASDQAQNAVNEKSAQHSSIFVAGARPFIMWVCGFSLAYQYLLAPMAVWIAALAGKTLPMPPTIDAVMWELMFGMLGMGALRSFEKIKGVAK